MASLSTKNVRRWESRLGCICLWMLSLGGKWSLWATLSAILLWTTWGTIFHPNSTSTGIYSLGAIRTEDGATLCDWVEPRRDGAIPGREAWSRYLGQKIRTGRRDFTRRPGRIISRWCYTWWRNVEPIIQAKDSPRKTALRL